MRKMQWQWIGFDGFQVQINPFNDVCSLRVKCASPPKNRRRCHRRYRNGLDRFTDSSQQFSVDLKHQLYWSSFVYFFFFSFYLLSIIVHLSWQTFATHLLSLFLASVCTHIQTPQKWWKSLLEMSFCPFYRKNGFRFRHNNYTQTLPFTSHCITLNSTILSKRQSTKIFSNNFKTSILFTCSSIVISFCFFFLLRLLHFFSVYLSVCVCVHHISGCRLFVRIIIKTPFAKGRRNGKSTSSSVAISTGLLWHSLDITVSAREECLYEMLRQRKRLA